MASNDDDETNLDRRQGGCDLRIFGRNTCFDLVGFAHWRPCMLWLVTMFRSSGPDAMLACLLGYCSEIVTVETP